MFTGLVESKGKVQELIKTNEGVKLVIETSLRKEVQLGDSIAINGVCLTAEHIDINSDTIIFHVLQQTLSCTSLGCLEAKDAVNLERAMALGERFGGHIVSGHVDCTTTLSSFEDLGGEYKLTFHLPESYQELIIDKGSIAIDGISLTVAHLAVDTFTVHIIPVTWEETNLSQIKLGSTVNLEFDMIGKYIQRSATLKANIV
ncbi:MAG: riboflavin synthase [Lentisphaeria bacterium]|nr:riboflavin synthase [Lentisphaeria bacterium]